MQPKSAIGSDDFTDLTKAVDAHIAATGDLVGVLIDARAFPGWRSFGEWSTTSASSMTIASVSRRSRW